MSSALKARLPDYSVVNPPPPLRTTATPPVNEIRGDKIWTSDVKILFARDRLLEIMPHRSMTWEENLNAMVRFVCYLSILIYAYNQDPKYVVFGGLVIAALALIYVPNDVSDTRWYTRFRQHNVAPVQRVPCQMSTPENPFANFLPTDDPHRPQPCPQSDPEQARLTRHHFDDGFPRDADPTQQDASFAQFTTRHNGGPLRDQAAFGELCGKPSDYLL